MDEATAVDRPATDARQSALPPADSVVTAPLRAALFRLAAPVLAEQLLNTCVGLTDVLLAGHISPAATSAVGLAAYGAWLASMLVMLVATGTTALVARRTGAGELREANHFANESLTLGAAVGIPVGALIFFGAPLIAHYSNLTGATFPLAVDFLRLDAIGHVFLAITLVGCAAMRGAGDTRRPMMIFAAINLVNIGFSIGLVHGYGPLPKLGTTGIVLGTVIAQVTGFLLTAFVLRRGAANLRLEPRMLRPTRDRALRILRIGGPAALDGSVIWAGHFVFLAVISHLADPPLGEAIFAAHVVAIRVEALTYLPAFAYGTAAATMIGQALGARQPERAMRVGREAVTQCGMLAVAMAAFYYLGADAIFRTMTTDSLVRLAGTEPFRALALLQPCLVVSIVLVGGLRGAGDTRYPLVISLIGSLLLRPPIGWLFGIVLGWGLIGAWMGMFADMIWRATSATLRFRGGRWTRIRA